MLHNIIYPSPEIKRLLVGHLTHMIYKDKAQNKAESQGHGYQGQSQVMFESSRWISSSPDFPWSCHK